MNDFDRLAPMMRDVVMAVDETKEQLRSYNAQLISLFRIVGAVPAYYEMFHFHQFGWEVREGTVYVYTESGSRVVVCGEHKLMRHPELGISLLYLGQNNFKVLDDAKRKS